jgi:hypothetical protein
MAFQIGNQDKCRSQRMTPHVKEIITVQVQKFIPACICVGNNNCDTLRH